MRKWIGKRVPSKNIILEERSKITIENAIFSEKIMNRMKMKSAIIVTSDFHLRRAKRIFKRAMPEMILCFAGSRPNLSSMQYLYYWIRERVMEL